MLEVAGWIVGALLGLSMLWFVLAMLVKAWQALWRRIAWSKAPENESVPELVGIAQPDHPSDTPTVHQGQRAFVAAVEASWLRQTHRGYYWLTSPESLARLSAPELARFTERLTLLAGEPANVGDPGYDLELETKQAGFEAQSRLAEARNFGADLRLFLDTVDSVAERTERLGSEATLEWLIRERLLRDVGSSPGPSQRDATVRLREMGEPRAAGRLLDAIESHTKLANNDCGALVDALAEVLDQVGAKVDRAALVRAMALSDVSDSRTYPGEFDPGHSISCDSRSVDCSRVNRLARTELARRAQEPNGGVSNPE